MTQKQIPEAKPARDPFLKPADTPTAGAGTAYLLAQLRRLTGGG